eukprot:8965016-Pyramimonas_sp.AAC.1
MRACQTALQKVVIPLTPLAVGAAAPHARGNRSHGGNSRFSRPSTQSLEERTRSAPSTSSRYESQLKQNA